MKVLVTGATGFLGKALTRRLINEGEEVTAVGRNLTVLTTLKAGGARIKKINLEDQTTVEAVCQGQEIVFHCGALSSPWGKPRDFYVSNVIGTQNVIQGCQNGGVRRLVYVSTPSIYFQLESRMNVREDAPLPSRPVNLYALTKLLAEKEIDRAFKKGLGVITIRPRAIFGPEDSAILPRLIARLRGGRLPVIGDGKNKTDMTYVENVVDALLLCAASGEETSGKKYNISNGEPVLLWKMIADLCRELGFRVPTRHIPYRLADGAASILEKVYSRLPGYPEPPLTRYTVAMIARSTSINIEAARKDLGFSPRVSVEDGLRIFVNWWRENRK